MIRLRTLQVLMVLVGLALVLGLYPLVTSLFHLFGSEVDAGDQMILGMSFSARNLSIVGSPEPLGTSQPDRLHRVVDGDAHGGDDGAGIPSKEPTRRSTTAGRDCSDRCCLHPADTAEGIQSADLIGEQLGNCVTVALTSPCHSACPSAARFCMGGNSEPM